MRFGIYLPNSGPLTEPQNFTMLGQAAEEAGWEGVFLSDNLLAGAKLPVWDSWLLLSALAQVTTQVKIGPLITAVPRAVPGKLARETVTLDHISRGRLALGVGSGDDFYMEYSSFGGASDPHALAAMLDEGLAVLAGLWSGQPFNFTGKYYQAQNVAFHPTPYQQPRIPIWVAGAWPNKAPFRRAAQWDGVVPNSFAHVMTPAEYREMLAFVYSQRTATTPFDVVHIGSVQQLTPQAIPATIKEYVDAGVTWWLESFNHDQPLDQVLRLVKNGPPAAQE